MVELPIACTLDASEMPERRARWERLSRRALLDAAPTASGARLSFRALPGVDAELRELARLERECCAFARFEVSADESAVVLDISAAPDAVGAVRSLFLPAAA